MFDGEDGADNRVLGRLLVAYTARERLGSLLLYLLNLEKPKDDRRPVSFQ